MNQAAQLCGEVFQNNVGHSLRSWALQLLTATFLLVMMALSDHRCKVPVKLQ
jgi:hypothetical protein